MKRFIIVIAVEYLDDGRCAISNYLNDFDTLEEVLDYLNHLKFLEEHPNFTCFDITDTFENHSYLYDSTNGLVKYE